MEGVVVQGTDGPATDDTGVTVRNHHEELYPPQRGHCKGGAEARRSTSLRREGAVAPV
jgi:hypothetical protein